MKKHVLKPVIGGLLFGTLVFFAAPLLVIVLLLKFIFTPFGMGRMMWYERFGGPAGYHPGMRYAMAGKIRNMSDDEFAAFTEKMNRRFNCGPIDHHQK